jgi:hypothetical protein
MLIFVAHTEDASHYRRGVTFFDGQLMQIVGIASWRALDRARKVAVAGGWLHYEPGGKGRAGVYWTLVPARAAGLDDLATDEGDGEMHLRSAGESAGERANCAQVNGQSESSPFNPVPDPDPIPNTPLPPKGGKRSRTISSPEEAEELYQLYPRHEAKADGLKAINRALMTEKFDVLREAVVAYATARKGADPQFTPLPATWFRKERWKDDRREWSRQAGRDSTPNDPSKSRENREEYADFLKRP